MNKLITTSAFLLAAVLLTTAANADINVGGVDNGKGGSVKGVVKFDGGERGLIQPKPIVMTADPFCKKAHKTAPRSERWVFGKDAALQNVFVTVVKGLEGKTFDPPAKAHLVDQIGCMYTPHVSGVVVGQEVHIKNSDSTLHNVHLLPRENEEGNVGQPVKGMIYKTKFPKAEEGLFIKCDVHAWMSTYLHVVPHPYFAVTQNDGTFEIKGLPAGKYTIKFWHEFRRFQPNKAEIEVTITEGKAADVGTVTYKPAARK